MGHELRDKAQLSERWSATRIWMRAQNPDLRNVFSHVAGFQVWYLPCSEYATSPSREEVFVLRHHGWLETAGPGEQIFCGITSSTLEKYGCIGMQVRFDSGMEIFHEGDPSESIHVLRSGRVKLISTSREGRRMILKIAQAGEVLGLSASVAGLPHELTAETMEPCRVTSVRSRSLHQLLAGSPEVGIRVARLLAQEYNSAFAELRKVALSTGASGRIVNLLLEWVRQHTPENTTSRHCVMTLTHQEIAAMAATSRETVTRVLGKLKRMQLISISGVALTVLQPQALEQLAI